MIKFDGTIVQFGFGAVGKSFYEKISHEIKFNENKYFVITKYANEFDAFINLGGMTANFISEEITKSNFDAVFGKYLSNGDLLLDFADTVGTKDICDWCAQHNIMYLNTGDADWPEDWLNIFSQHQSIKAIQDKHRNNFATNQHPIVLHHGNNPGLVSHFVKAGIDYIARTQHKKDKQLKRLLQEHKFNEAAQRLKLQMIHINDIDLQQINKPYEDTKLYNTWCIDSFLFESLTQATMTLGTHEALDFAQPCNSFDSSNGFLEFTQLGAQTTCRTYYPGGAFDGFLIPHEETITIAKGLEVTNNGQVVYRPSVMFLYRPCHLAREYLQHAKVNDYPVPDPAKPLDCNNQNEPSIIRGYRYPENAEIVYREHIAQGTEYVGVLLLGENFQPVWVGNRIEPSFLYKKEKDSYWQTPTITPVAMSALSAVCWMLRHKDQRGIYFPDDLPDYKQILKTAEKYISKTIYQTFETDTLQQALNIDFVHLQSKDFLVDG